MFGFQVLEPGRSNVFRPRRSTGYVNRKKGFLLLAIGLATLLCFRMVSPYLGYLLTGSVLAFLLQPLKKRLDGVIPNPSLFIVLLTVVVAVVPFLVAASVVASDAEGVASTISAQDLSLDDLDAEIRERFGVDLEIEERVKTSIQAIGARIVASTSMILNTATKFLIGASLMLFLQYYLLKQGESVVEWTLGLDLMPENIQRSLYRKTANTTRTVVRGHIVTAIFTGLVAGLGFFVAGVNNLAFWTVLMMVLGLIPMVGAATIWAPYAVYFMATGRVIPGIFLLIYGVLVVGSVDNFLRPFLVDESADLHPMFIMLGVIGGIGVFGPVGVFIGPVMFGVAKSLITIYIQHYDELS